MKTRNDYVREATRVAPNRYSLCRRVVEIVRGSPLPVGEVPGAINNALAAIVQSEEQTK